MTALNILAGERAYQHIKKEGLSPQDISVIFGASGAAKWLTICELDKIIFSQWLIDSNQPIDLLGTSIGAFKLAAAAQNNPSKALEKLANSYIEQYYSGDVTPKKITIETNRIIDEFLDSEAIDHICTNPRLHYHCVSARTTGWLTKDNLNLQKLSMVKAFLLSSMGREKIGNIFSRTIFHTKSIEAAIRKNDNFRTDYVQLNKSNFRSALISSGSIPVIMEGVNKIEGAKAGVHVDGGLIDYHPIPKNLSSRNKGFVLYPHFYTHLTEGWFDKFFPWRSVPRDSLKDVIIIGPSADYVKSLPDKKIPDRMDFKRFLKNDNERVRRWRIALKRGVLLGEEFIDLARSGQIAEQVKLM